MKLARARLHLADQPHIFNRDHGLVGEGGEQLDLFLAERLDTRARDNRIPIGTPSRSNGTPSTVRKPPRLCASSSVYPGSASTSTICVGRRSSIVRPTMEPRPSIIGTLRRAPELDGVDRRSAVSTVCLGTEPPASLS